MTFGIAPNPRGWAQPDNARKMHYFVHGMSLCTRWALTGVKAGSLVDADHGSPANCILCMIQRERLEAREWRFG